MISFVRNRTGTFAGTKRSNSLFYGKLLVNLFSGLEAKQSQNLISISVAVTKQLIRKTRLKVLCTTGCGHSMAYQMPKGKFLKVSA